MNKPSRIHTVPSGQVPPGERQKAKRRSPAPRDTQFRAGQIPSPVARAVAAIEVHLAKKNYAAAVKIIRRLRRRRMAKLAAWKSGKHTDEVSIDQKLDMPLASIGLTVRTANILELAGLRKVRALVNSRPDDLLSIQNFGQKALEECLRCLGQIGLRPRHLGVLVIATTTNQSPDEPVKEDVCQGCEGNSKAEKA